MKTQTLGLAIIAKNEEDNIEQALSSILPYVDHVYLTDTGSTDKTVEKAKTICEMNEVPITVSHFEWINDFAAARNFNFDQAETDWVFWMDCDDVIENPQKLKKLVNLAPLQNITGIHFTYRYQVDSQGNDVISHPKLRLVDRKYYEWFRDHAQVHENLVIKNEFMSRKREIFDTTVKVRHMADEEHLRKSAERNLKILREMEVREKDKPDARTIYLLGREYHTQDKFDEALNYLLRYLKMVKVGSERMEACSMIADIYKRRGNFPQQLVYSIKGMHSYPNTPKGYLMIAESYMNLGDYKEAITWVGYAKERNVEDSDPMIQSPKGLLYQSAVILANCYAGLKEYKKAFDALQTFIPMADKGIKDELYPIMQQYEERELEGKYAQGFTRLAHLLLRTHNVEKIPTLLSLVPEEMAMRQEVLNLKRDLGLRKEWNKGNIVIFCGGGLEPWNEDTIKTRGLGGSETAVVEMSKRFGKMGYKVTIYNNVEEKAIFGNVTYLPYNEVNLADKFDIFVVWRNAHILSLFDIQCNKLEFWAHDVLDPQQFTEQIINKVDKFILLSKFHRTFVPNIPEDKIYYSSNGIDVETIEKIEKEGIERNPYQVIYSSSPDRDLEFLLDIWPEVLKEVPQAKLKPVYGWDTFISLRKDIPELMAWKEEMQKKMKDLGVEDTIRLTKEDLYREYFRSAIHAYPTKFDEINCIVIQESQVAGCYAVTTGHGAIKEKQFTGIMIDREHFKDELVKALKGERLVWTITDLKAEFSWNKTARDWANDLFYGVEFEQEMPLVNVVCITIRPGPFRILKETLEKQTYKNFNLIIIDGRYDERYKEVEEYFKDASFPVLHLPDPNRDKSKYPYGLFHADNAALYSCNGDLSVFLQDFIEIPSDGIEKYVENYRNSPEAIYTGVDIRVKVQEKFGFNNKINAINAITQSDRLATMKELRSIDVLYFSTYEIVEKDFESPRNILKGATRHSKDPFEWELNWAAAPTKVLRRLGGWQQEWDKGFAFDNTELALRHVYSGGEIIVDETNQCTAISHWEIFGDHDEEGVENRNDRPNDKRFSNYLEWLQQTPDANVIEELLVPDYSDKLLKKIQKWKNQ